MKARERDIAKLIQKAEQYIRQHNLDISVEQLYAEFEQLLGIYKDFRNYINQDQNLKYMYRNKSKLEKRELFINWYLQKHQNNRRIKTTLTELSDLLFVSSKTIEKQLF